MRRFVPEPPLEPPENYLPEPEPCRKCKEDECYMHRQDECPILEEYYKQLEAEERIKKQEEEWQREEDRQRFEDGEEGWNPDWLVKFKE